MSLWDGLYLHATAEQLCPRSGTLWDGILAARPAIKARIMRPFGFICQALALCVGFNACTAPQIYSSMAASFLMALLDGEFLTARTVAHTAHCNTVDGRDSL